MRIFRFISLTVTLLLFAVLTGCSSAPIKHWPSKTAQVIDKHSMEPIADVHVIARWRGRGMVQTFCYHVETAKTNKDGYFTIPGTLDGPGKSFWSQRHVLVSFYKPGYTGASTEGKSFYNLDKAIMEKFKGTRKERFDFLSSHSGRMSCHDSGVSSRNAFGLYKAMYEEAKSLAKNKEEKKDVQWLRIIMASKIDKHIVSLTGEEQEKRVNEILKEQEK